MRFSGSDLDYLVATAKEAAASEILPRFHAIAAADISVKDRSIDVVTEADTRAEALIKKQLAAKFPGALIVGEESYEADKSIMDGLAEADLAFVRLLQTSRVFRIAYAGGTAMGGPFQG